MLSATGSEARAAFTAALQEIVIEALAELSKRFGTAPPVPVSIVSATFSGPLSSIAEAWLKPPCARKRGRGRRDVYAHPI